MRRANEGTENETQRTGRSQKRSFSGRKLILPLAIVAVVLVVVIVAMMILPGMLSGEKFSLIDRAAMPVMFDDETIYFLAGGEKIDSRMDADSIVKWNASMDGNVVCFTVQEDEDEVMYILSDSNVYTVTENMTQFVMAESGKVVTYVLEEELYAYTVSKMTSEKIASDVESIQTISPDGKTVAYVDMDGITRVISGDNVMEMEEDVTVISVSDDGKYIYTIEENEDGETCLFLRNMKGVVGVVAVDVKYSTSNKNENDQTTTQATNTDAVLFYTNKDHSQLIFQAKGKSDYKWYAAEKKELNDEKHDLSGADLLVPVIPENAQTYTRDNLVILGVDSISDMVYSTAKADEEYVKLVYVDSKWNTSTLVSKVTNVQVGADGENVFYMKNDRLFSIAAEAGAQSAQLADGVALFKVTADGSGVYFVDEDDVLYYCKSNGTVKQIAETAESLYVAQDGYAFYTFEDSLYAAKGTGKVTTVVEDFTDGEIEVCADCTYYVMDEDDSLCIYVATSGTKFEKLGVLMEAE